MSRACSKSGGPGAPGWISVGSSGASAVVNGSPSGTPPRPRSSALPSSAHGQYGGQPIVGVVPMAVGAAGVACQFGEFGDQTGLSDASFAVHDRHSAGLVAAEVRPGQPYCWRVWLPARSPPGRAGRDASRCGLAVNYLATCARRHIEHCR